MIACSSLSLPSSFAFIFLASFLPSRVPTDRPTDPTVPSYFLFCWSSPIRHLFLLLLLFFFFFFFWHRRGNFLAASRNIKFLCIALGTLGMLPEGSVLTVRSGLWGSLQRDRIHFSPSKKGCSGEDLIKISWQPGSALPRSARSVSL